jgi:hypothetical protein
VAAGLAAFAVALEIAVAQAGRGPMQAPARWLFVGSVAVVFAAFALIQLAATPEPTDPERQIVVSRLLGIPFLFVIGFLGGLEAQWIVVGVLGVCVAELIADKTSSLREGALEEGIPID